MPAKKDTTIESKKLEEKWKKSLGIFKNTGLEKHEAKFAENFKKWVDHAENNPEVFNQIIMKPWKFPENPPKKQEIIIIDLTKEFYVVDLTKDK